MITGSSSSVYQAASSLLKSLEDIENEFQKADVRDPNSTAGRTTRGKLRSEIDKCDSKIFDLVSSTLAFSEKDLNKCLEIKEKLYSLNRDISEVEHSIEARNQTVPSLSIWQRILSLFISYPKTEDKLTGFRFNAFCKGLQEKREKLVEAELTGMNILVKTDSDVKTEAEMRRKLESLSRSMQTGSVAAVGKIGEHAIDLQILSKPERELISRKITVRITDDGYELESEVNGKQYFRSLPELLRSYGFTPKTSDDSINSIKPYFLFDSAPKVAATAKEHISRLLDLALPGKGHFCLVKSGERTFDLLVQPEKEGEQIREYSLIITPQGNFAIGDDIFQNFFELKNKLNLNEKTASQALIEHTEAKLKTMVYSKEKMSEEQARELLIGASIGAYIIRGDEQRFQLIGIAADENIYAFRIDAKQDPGNICLLSRTGNESARGAKLEECAKRLGFTSLMQASKRSEVIAALKEQLDPLKGKGIEARYKATSPQMKLNQTYYLISYDGDDLESLKEFTLHTFVKEKTGPIAKFAGRFGPEKVTAKEKTYKVNTQGQITFGNEVYDSFEAFLKSIDGIENFLELEDAYTELKDHSYTTKELADQYIEKTIRALGSSGAKGAYALFEHDGKFFMHIVHPRTGILWRDREVTIKDNKIALVGMEDTFESFEELKDYFGIREQEEVQKQIEERVFILEKVKKLEQFISDGRSTLQNYVKLFGSRADGNYAIYIAQDGEVKEEICIAYVKNGNVVNVVLDTTDASFVEELAKSNTLTKSLLDVVEEVDLQPKKDMKAIAKEYLDITTKEGEIKQKVGTIYKEKAVAMKNLLSISELLGNAACDGAYAIVENPAKRGEYSALVFKNNTVETYLLDLLLKPGKIVLQPGNSTMTTINDMQAIGFKKPVDAYQEDLKQVERQFAELTESDAFESSVRTVGDMVQFLHLAKILGDQAQAVWCVRKKEEAKTQNGWTGWVSSFWRRKEATPTLELPKEGYCITLIKNDGSGDFLVEDYDIAFDTAQRKVKVQNTLYNSLDEAIKELVRVPAITTKELVKLHEKAKVQEQIIATQDMATVSSLADFGKSVLKVREYSKKTPYAIFFYPTKRDVLNYTHNSASTSLLHSKQEITLAWPNPQGELEVRHLDVCKMVGEICVEEEPNKHFKVLDEVVHHYCGNEVVSIKSVWDGFHEWTKGHLKTPAAKEKEETAVLETPKEPRERRARGRKSQGRPAHSARSSPRQSLTPEDIQKAILDGENDEERLHTLLRQHPSLKATISDGDDASTGELARMVLGRVHGQNIAVDGTGLRTLSTKIQSQMSQREDREFIKELIRKAKV